MATKQVTLTLPSFNLLRMVRKKVYHFLNSYIFTPEVLAPLYVTVGVLALGVLVSSEPYDGPARLFAGLALLMVGGAAGWLFRARQQVIYADQVEMAILAAEERAQAADAVQVYAMETHQRYQELKRHVRRLVDMRRQRIEHTGETKVVGRYRILDRALP